MSELTPKGPGLAKVHLWRRPGCTSLTGPFHSLNFRPSWPSLGVAGQTASSEHLKLLFESINWHSSTNMWENWVIVCFILEHNTGRAISWHLGHGILEMLFWIMSPVSCLKGVISYKRVTDRCARRVVTKLCFALKVELLIAGEEKERKNWKVAIWKFCGRDQS